MNPDDERMVKMPSTLRSTRWRERCLVIDDPILRGAIREARERGWLRELAVFLVMFAAFVALFFVLGPPG